MTEVVRRVGWAFLLLIPASAAAGDFGVIDAGPSVPNVILWKDALSVGVGAAFLKEKVHEKDPPTFAKLVACTVKRGTYVGRLTKPGARIDGQTGLAWLMVTSGPAKGCKGVVPEAWFREGKG
jgi:hypothetical protein